MATKSRHRSARWQQVHLLNTCVYGWLFFGLYFVFLGGGAAKAEPWISTRFAQNCAGCHAPGRKNLAPIDRRCTLSCQGCHVNPNGGGMRSFYGKWNENYWLKSVRLPQLKNPPMFIPYPTIAKRRVPWEKADRKQRNVAVLQGYRLETMRSDFPPEKDSDRYANFPYEIKAQSRAEFEYQIPQDDPYRLMDRHKIDGGGDFRWIHTKDLSEAREGAKVGAERAWLMQATFGLRYRPFRDSHLVYEAVMLGAPVKQSINTLPGSETTGSLFVMQDNLPYNVFVMGGFYRPLFGNYTADHTSLPQVMVSRVLTGQSNRYRSLFKAVSIGTAPNVPYLNLHGIFGSEAPNETKEKGVAGNLGLRFVTLGASVNYSFWVTKEDTETEGVAVTKEHVMHSMHLAATYKKFVLGVEGISMARDVSSEDFREGGVYNIEAKYRFFREIYATLDYALANTTADLLPGSASQGKVGVRGFIFPGFELSTQLNLDVEDKNERKGLSTVLHTYF